MAVDIDLAGAIGQQFSVNGSAVSLGPVTKPTVSVGDLWVVFIALDATPSGTMVTVPTGWTRISSEGGLAATPDGWVATALYRVIDGTEGTGQSFTINSGGGSSQATFSTKATGAASTLRNAATTNLANQSSPAALDGAALTGAVTGDMAVWMVYTDVSASLVSETITAPTGYSALQTIRDPGTWGTLAVAKKAVTATGTEPAPTGGTDTLGSGTVGGGVINFILAPAATSPVITAQPTDQTTNAGATATFSVTATGATSYQWQDDSGGSFADIVGATSSSYTTGTATYSMQGRLYRCNVTNANGTTTSSSAALRVAFNLAGTGPMSVPTFGGAFGGGTVESFIRAIVAAGSNFTYTGSGGLTFGGVATTIESRNYVMSAAGGIVFGGAATALASANYSFAGSGGIVLAGAATTSQTANYSATSAGGIVFGGAATITYTFAYSAAGSGGLQFGGAGTVSQTSQYSVAGAGGIVFGGAADAIGDVGFVITGSGGVVFGGAASAQQTADYSAAASGGLQLGGAATAAQSSNYAMTMAGGLIFGGTAAADINAGFSITGSGGITFAGAATTLQTSAYAITSSGGILFGGAAVVDFPGTGSVIFVDWLTHARRRGRR